jgi:multiple antibiotic resistance protein
VGRVCHVLRDKRVSVSGRAGGSYHIVASGGGGGSVSAMSMTEHFWELILGTVIALLPLINPLAIAPTFLAITEGDTRADRMRQLGLACIYMVIILVSFLVGGTFIMGFFGISIPGLRIAGGFLVAGIGYSMLMGPRRGESEEAKANQAARAKRDISFSPLAMPMMSGPGSIAVTVGFTSLATGVVDYIAIILGILAVAVITYVTLRLSEGVVKLIGVNGMNALSKVMGFLILCIGIQFVVNGISGILTDPALIRGIREAVQKS